LNSLTADDSEREDVTQMADPVMQALEVDTAWRAQKHHERIAATLREELELEVAYRERLKIKARGFDRLAHLLNAEAAAWGDLTEVVKTVTHKFDLLSELQNKPGS
jgi:hypothetical protein